MQTMVGNQGGHSRGERGGDHPLPKFYLTKFRFLDFRILKIFTNIHHSRTKFLTPFLFGIS